VTILIFCYKNAIETLTLTLANLIKYYMKIVQAIRSLSLMTATVVAASFLLQCKGETKKEEVKVSINETILKAPEGFSVEEIGKELGAVRHLTVAKNGDVYANRSVVKEGGQGIIMLRDSNKDGTMDEQHEFADLPGTGILAKDDYLYASSNSGVFRYALNDSHEIIDANNPEKIVDGLIDMGRDNAKPFAIDDENNLFVTIGAWSDVCKDEKTGKGIMPCTMLDSAAGIWKFKTNNIIHTYADGRRYAT